MMDDYSENLPLKPIEYPEFRFLKPSRDIPGKKLALTEAIRRGEGEYILVTDADCIPASTLWAEKMVSHLSQTRDIVLGYSPYQKGKGILNAFIRFEAWQVAVQYLSYAIKGMPYMGVGRNMLYKKSLFERANPFDKHPDLLSGDDDLLINAIATAENTTVCIDPEAFVYSEPKETWRAYLQQKKRHITTAHTYQTKHILLLGLFSASQIFVFVGIIFLLFSSWWIYALISFAMYYCIKWVIASRLMKILGEDDLRPWFPVMDIMYTLFIVILAPFLIFKSKSW